jgi:hypothetical protein
MTDADPARTAEVIRQAEAHLHAITVAKQAAMQRLSPRTPARMSADQLAEAWRRSGIRDPRRQFAPNVVEIAARRSQAAGD